ncbi:hypothetical protein [Celeribacter baekdonensis]|uniref:Uncharacterized protein n=1 Tax=Celeribacter baekdonensis TaxID=875171 RepID=A0A2R4M8S9_9RHOB|nr:hypothetical protein [Celeribacter baekdonensis]AVW93594.1 hypothetical protein DA792_21380 [Celeribacter baekdonensis]
MALKTPCWLKAAGVPCSTTKPDELLQGPGFGLVQIFENRRWQQRKLVELSAYSLIVIAIRKKAKML